MANYNIKPRLSIESYGTPVPIPYLNATAEQHNGMTGNKFLEYLDLELSNAKIGKLAGVSAATAKDWKRRYREGQV